VDTRIDSQKLGGFALFKGLSPAVLARIAHAFRVEQHEAGTVVFREGEQGDKLYLIISGTVRISQRLGPTGEEALAVLHQGDYFGDMALIDAHPRSADAIVEETTITYTIRRNEFLSLLRGDVELTINVLFRFIDTLVERLRVNNDKIRALNLMSMW